MVVYNLEVEQTEYMQLELIPANIIIISEQDIDLNSLASIEEVLKVTKINRRIATRIPKVSTILVGSGATNYLENIELFLKAYTNCKK